MLRSDWLSYYQAIRYSPLVAKAPASKTKTIWRLNRVLLAKVVLSRYF